MSRQQCGRVWWRGSPPDANPEGSGGEVLWGAKTSINKVAEAAPSAPIQFWHFWVLPPNYYRIPPNYYQKCV